MSIEIKVSEIMEKFGLTLITDGEGLENTVTNVYIGDLLSWVMGRAKESCAWITIQGHINIIAVALLVNASCIIVAEGASVDPDSIAKANAEDIPILTSSKTSYELAELFSALDWEA